MDLTHCPFNNVSCFLVVCQTLYKILFIIVTNNQKHDIIYAK